MENVDPEWQDHAACRQMRSVFFAGTNKLASSLAKSVCHACPVEDECLVYALGHYTEIEFGTWSGLTAEQRKAIWKNQATFNDWSSEFRDPDGCVHARQGGTLVPIQTRDNLDHWFCMACRSTVKFL